MTNAMFHRAAMIEGKPHPDPIVETSSLASIRAPKQTYQHHLQVSLPLFGLSLDICQIMRKMALPANYPMVMKSAYNHLNSVLCIPHLQIYRETSWYSKVLNIMYCCRKLKRVGPCQMRSWRRLSMPICAFKQRLKGVRFLRMPPYCSAARDLHTISWTALTSPERQM